MAKIELSRELAISPEEAWSHVSNLEELGDWLTMHEGWRSELPTELEKGTTLVGVAGAKGMRNRVTWTIERIEVPTLLEIKGSGVGGAKYALKMAVTPSKKGSKFALRIDLGGAPLFGPVGMAAARAVKGDIEKSIQKFVELYG
jgi:uncharacterized protein YndB with AHSA1/START domain